MPQALGLLLFTLGAPVGLVTAVSTGIGASLVSIGLSVGLSYLGSLLQPKPQAPKPSDVKTNIREPTQPRFRSYGLVRVGGVVAFLTAKDERFVKVVALGQGRINAVLEHWIDDNKVTIGPDGFYNGDTAGTTYDGGRLRIEYRLGDEVQVPYSSVINLVPSIWTTNHVGNGFPHAAIILKQPKAEKFQELFPNGVQTKYSQVQESAILFDPRTNTDLYSENAALVIRDYLTSQWGLRLPEQSLTAANDDWISAANTSDEAVALKGGGSEKRWRIGMTYAFNERPGDVLQRMLDACDGSVFPTAEGGLTVKVGRWEEPTVVLDEDCITSIAGLTRGGDILTRFNTFRAQYTSKAHDFEEVDADPWVNEDLVSLYGETSKDVQIFASPSHSQTRRLMKLLERRTNPRWRATLSCNLSAMAVMGERFVTVRLPEYGIDESFEIQGQPQFIMGEENVIIGVQVEVIAMDASAYAWDPAAEEGTPPPVPDRIEDDNDLPLPSGFSVNTISRSTAGQPFTYAVLSAGKPAREDYYLYFELSSDGGGTWVEVPHEQSSNQAEYGPLNDSVTYQARARIITTGKTLGDPTVAATFTATSIAPTPLATFSAVLATAASVNLSAKAANDTATKKIQFRRGTTSQAFSAATVIGSYVAAGNDTRTMTDTPSTGTWRYWATALNASGGVATTPSGPSTITLSP